MSWWKSHIADKNPSLFGKNHQTLIFGIFLEGEGIRDVSISLRQLPIDVVLTTYKCWRKRVDIYLTRPAP